jgi:predicted Zn-dependent peptidase
VLNSASRPRRSSGNAASCSRKSPATTTNKSVAYHAASEVFWSDQSLGRPILGPAEMIRTIPGKTIMAYMADNHRASRMVLSVSGNID